MRRAVAVLVLLVAVLVGTAVPAAADVSASSLPAVVAPHAVPSSPLVAGDEGSGAWFDLKDSHGVSVWRMNMEMDTGRFAFAEKFWSVMMQAGWAVYQVAAASMIWGLSWALSSDWYQWALTYFENISFATHEFMDKLGLGPLVLLVLSVVVGWWFLRGRHGKAVSELVVGCVIASLATGWLADPMSLVAGDDGLLAQGRSAGFQLAGAIVYQEPGNLSADGTNHTVRSDRWSTRDVDGWRNGLTAQMTTTMIRTPHQLLNYGKVLDGTDCERAYDEAMLGDGGVRGAVADCDDEAKEYSGTPSALTTMTVWSSAPMVAGLGLLTLAVILMLVATVLGAAWTAVKTIVQLVFAPASRDARAGLFKSLAMLLFAMFMMASATVFTVVWMQLLQTLMQASEGWPWILRVWMVNITLLVGAVVLWRWRSKVKKKMAAAAARLAGAEPDKSRTQVIPFPVPPRRRPDNKPAAVTQAARSVVDLGNIAARGRGGRGGGAAPQLPSGPRPQLPPGGGMPGPTGPQPTAGGPPPGPGRGRPGGTGPKPRRPDPNAPSRLKQRLRTAAKAAALVAEVAVAAGTGGSSAAASGAARAARAASRVSKTARTARQAWSTADAVRGQLKDVQMRRTGNRAVDERSGRTYTVWEKGPQTIYQPNRRTR